MRTGGIGAELTASINDRLFDELDAHILALRIFPLHNGT